MMSTNRFWHRGISLACLGVFSLFLMTAATGCNNCCMRKGDGDNQAQAGFAKCTKACCAKAQGTTTQAQAGFAKCGANCANCPNGANCANCAQGCRKGKAKTTAGATTAAVNKTCPISGRTVSAGATVSYGDKTVGFCCGGCIGKWNALTDADKTSKLTGA